MTIIVPNAERQRKWGRGAEDTMLRFAVLSGLCPDIKKNYVTMQQPTTWNELVQAARVDEMCVPVVAAPDPNISV